MDALTFLERATDTAVRPIYVVFGEEAFLKRQILASLRHSILGDGDDAFALSTHTGERATLADVMADVETLPFLAPRRLVVVEQADEFVSTYRAQLEKYLAKPARSGILVLEVKSWPANTRLAKLLDDKAVIQCKPLTGQQIPSWCVRRIKHEHDKTLSTQAAKLLLELVGNDLGLLDQELAKLACYAGQAKKIEFEDVDDLVGRHRMADAFRIFDSVADSKPAEALRILDRLFEQGEDAFRIEGAFSYELRCLARGYRLHRQGQSLHSALEDGGYRPFAVRRGEQLLRHLGRQRADHLYDWLLEVDQGMKGGSVLTPRQLVERMLVGLLARSQATSP
jgi:DNA polymerase-3 subunit delta